MKKQSKIIIGVIVITITVCVGYVLLKDVFKQTTVEPIKIGFIGPLTGEAANIGQNVKSAVEIAVQEVNNAGGINGRQLEVIYEDGQCSGKESINAFNKLVNVDRVAVIFGGACSSETMSFVSAAEEMKKVVLSYCASSPALTDAGDYIFRNVPSDTYQGDFVAKYFYNNLNKKRAAILYENSDYGNGIKEYFDKKYKELGGEVIIEEGYEQSSRDLRTQISKIKEANPEIIFFIGHTGATIPGLKQIKDIGLNIPVFGADAWSDPEIYSQAGVAAEGVMYSTVYSSLDDSFKYKMREKVGNDEITICSPQAYDGIKLLADVISRAGDDSEKIKNELYKEKYKNGVSASLIEFDNNGDMKSADYVVKTIKNGKTIDLQ